MTNNAAVSNFMKRVLLFLLMFCLMLNSISIGASEAYASGINDSTLPQCEGINEAVLRTELNKVIEKFLSTETESDFGAIINRQWRILDMDSVFDSQVDDAISTVNSNADLMNKFKSSWIPTKAGELAGKVTEIAFNSPVLNSKLDQLSKNVADELASKLELISAKSSSHAMDCLQHFINRQYSQTFVDVFGKKIQSSSPDLSFLPEPFDTDTQNFIGEHKFAFGGAAVFVVSRVTRKLVIQKIIERITQQVLERIAGRISTNVIPIIGEIIGGVLLASDLIKSFDGALPEIQKSLKMPTVKQTFREEITTKVKGEFREESSQIAREISNGIYAYWLEFQKDYRDVLTLAKELPEFQRILSTTPDLSKISSLVGIALNNMGRIQLVSSIKDGSFERALSLPEITFKILNTTHSLPILIEWTNLAGNEIEDVVKLELYKNLSPEKLDRQLLMDILSLKDTSVVAKISLLDIESIRRLLAISKPNLLTLSTDFSASDLKQLAGYLGGLEQFEMNEFVRFFLDNPTSIRNSRVIEYIIQSRDIQSAIEFWNAKADPSSLFHGALKMYTRAISRYLFISKFGIWVMILFVGLPIVFLLAISLWFCRKLLKIFQAWKSLETSTKPES